MSSLLQGLPSPVFVSVDTVAPAYIHNGLPFDDAGGLAVTQVPAIDHYHQGLPFSLVGRLCVGIAATPIDRVGSGGAVFTATNRLAFEEMSVVVYVNQGVGYSNNRRVVITTTNPNWVDAEEWVDAEGWGG